MNFLTLKALHLVGIVSWFAGLFYIVRLYIYHVEAEDKPELERKILKDQFKVMERRLLNGITTPAMVFSLITGIWLGIQKGIWSNLSAFPYFHLKLFFLFFLILYHFHLIRIRKNLLKDLTSKYSSKFLRFYNEVATILLVVIVFAVVIKDMDQILKSLLGFAIFFILLILLFLKRLQGKK